MQRLRHARSLARLVLVWFALAIGVAVAAPVLGAGKLELVCSGAAVKLVVQGEDGSTAPAGHTLECPLCATVGAPPPAAGVQGLALCAGSDRVQAPAPARIATRSAAPPPGRGPPAQA